MTLQTWLILIGIIVFFIIVYFVNQYFSRVKCPKCKKRNCSETSRQETSRQTIMFEEDEIISTVDNKKGLYGGAAQAHAQLTSQFGKPDSTTIRKYKVPGERIHYLATYTCSDCGTVFSKNIYIDNKPPTAK